MWSWIHMFNKQVLGGEVKIKVSIWIHVSMDSIYGCTNLQEFLAPGVQNEAFIQIQSCLTSPWYPVEV